MNTLVREYAEDKALAHSDEVDVPHYVMNELGSVCSCQAMQAHELPVKINASSSGIVCGLTRVVHIMIYCVLLVHMRCK